jgi:CRP/FNR family cyclic AMP-dependent transcriptional regulator
MATHPESAHSDHSDSSAPSHPGTNGSAALLNGDATAPPPTTTAFELHALIDLGVERSYRRGAMILNEGETGDAMYFLLKGRVRAYGSSATGKEITYGTIEAGEYFGEMALDGGTRSASVEAMEPCVCSVVSNAHVLAFMKTHSDFAVELLHTLTERARSATNAARDMALLDVYARLAQTLSRMAEPAQDNNPMRSIKAPITHSELAAFVGASREMVSKLMKDLERGGYIQVDNRYITLLKKLPARW